MKRVKQATAAILLLVASLQASAADVTYTFESISKMDMHRVVPSVTGLLINSSTPTTLYFMTMTNNGEDTSRCVPLFLTMLEKPGRYRLNITVATPSPGGYNTFWSCGLELKN